jgi:hypothetical protein
MPYELPIACSLRATELPVRQAQMAALGRDALMDTSVDGAHAELRFAAGAAVRERVEEFAATERACCAFLTMRIDDEPNAVLLSIDAPADAELVLAELVAVFGHNHPQAA